MKIRKYLAANVTEGLQQIRKELGNDALILQTRPVRRKGLRGIFTPRQVEILVALDSRPQEKMEITEALTRALAEEERAKKVQAELQELKTMVKQLVAVPPVSETVSLQDGVATKGPVAYWRRYLEHQDLDAALLQELFKESEIEFKGPGRLSQGRVAQILREKAIGRINVNGSKNQRTHIFVGPTGVGKTTTLAKIAARLALSEQESVGLVTIDHYRIGAIEQLRTYAEIMDLPLEVVYAPRDLYKALVRLERCQRILVDTAGRATGNREQMEELAGYIEQLLPAVVYLLISATTRQQDIRLIADSFSKLKVNRLIITKLDEAAVFGAILNSAYYTNLPLAYITDGQRVPEDIKLADEVELKKLLWGGG